MILENLLLVLIMIACSCVITISMCYVFMIRKDSKLKYRKSASIRRSIREIEKNVQSIIEEKKENNVGNNSMIEFNQNDLEKCDGLSVMLDEAMGGNRRHSIYEIELPALGETLEIIEIGQSSSSSG